MDQARAAFYGDSYTLGTGASSTAHRWSTIVCAERGWREFNPSINGLGFVNNRHNFGDGDLPSQIIASYPDFVFVTLGMNDNFSFAHAAEQIQSQVSTDLKYLRLALPDAHFIVVEPFWYTDDRPDSLSIITGWVKAVAEFIDADYVVGASHWLEGRPELMARDGLHPNDVGHALIAARMDAALAEARFPAPSRGTQAESIN